MQRLPRSGGPGLTAPGRPAPVPGRSCPGACLDRSCCDHSSDHGVTIESCTGRWRAGRRSTSGAFGVASVHRSSQSRRRSMADRRCVDHDHDRAGHRRGGSVADTVKKGARITGADRSKLAGELTKKYTAGGEHPRPGRGDRPVVRVRAPDPHRERGVAAQPRGSDPREGEALSVSASDGGRMLRSSSSGSRSVGLGSERRPVPRRLRARAAPPRGSIRRRREDAPCDPRRWPPRSPGTSAPAGTPSASHAEPCGLATGRSTSALAPVEHQLERGGRSRDRGVADRRRPGTAAGARLRTAVPTADRGLPRARRRSTRFLVVRHSAAAPADRRRRGVPSATAAWSSRLALLVAGWPSSTRSLGARRSGGTRPGSARD